MKALVKILDENARVRYPIHRLVVRIGRDPNCEIYLDGDDVSRTHAQVEMHGENILLTDLGSTNGTLVNDTPIAGPTVLTLGDRLQIGPHRLVLIDEPGAFLKGTKAIEKGTPRDLRVPAAPFKPEIVAPDDPTTILPLDRIPAAVAALAEAERALPRLVVLSGTKRGCVVPLVPPELDIGRAPESHLVLDDDRVSAHHARLVRRKNAFYLYDNRSLNGVFLNDARVRGVPIQSGDRFRLGDTLLLFEDPTQPAAPRQWPGNEDHKNVPSVYRGLPWIAAALAAVAVFGAMALLVWK